MERSKNGGRRAIALLSSLVVLIVFVAWLRRERHDAALEHSGFTERVESPVATADVATEVEADREHSAGTREQIDRTISMLRGRVLDEAGAPVEGAAVDARAERPEGPAIAAVRTQASGDFVLRVEDESCTYGLRIVAEGFYPACVEAVLPGSAPAVVVLRAAPSLKGRVSSTAGRPIAGARVRLVAQTEFGEVLELETTSDESGKYRLAAGLLDLEHLENPLLEASAEGFAPSCLHLRDFAWLLTRAPALLALERDLVLSRGNRFAGRVVDDSGAPVADAELVVFTHAGDGLFRDPYGTVRSSDLDPTAIATTHSAADGSFAFDGLPVRTGDGAGAGVAGDDESSMGSVRARKEGFALGGARLPWTTEGEPTEPLEIVLAPGASFRGRVVDEHGEPLDEVRVGFNINGAPLSTIVPNGQQPEGYGELIFWPPPKEGASSFLWVRTGADGRFRSPVLPCWSDGAISARTRVSWRHEYGEWRDLALAAGEESELGDLVFERRHVQVPIEGFVLDPAGAPVAGTEVELQDAGVRRTGRDGRFRFEHRLEPGAEFPALDLEVRARGFVTYREVLRAAPEHPLEIRLAAGLALHGTLSFQDGSPAAFGTVNFARPPQADRGAVWSEGIAWTTCDALGRFSLRELCPPP